MPDFVAATSAVSSGPVSSLAPAYASTTAGDLLLIFASISGLSTFTDPPGFTAITNGAADAGTVQRGKSWYREADGSESGTAPVAWTGGNQDGAVCMVALRGAEATTPVDVASTVGAVSTGTSRGNNPLTPTRTFWEMSVFADRQATALQAWTPPSGETERLDVCSTAAPFMSIEVADLNAVTAGTGVVTRTATSVQSGTSYIAWHLAVMAGMTAQTDLTDYSDAGPGLEGFVDPRSFTELIDTVDAVASWPASGQGWPRIKQG